MSAMPQMPCLTCGTLTTGSYCPRHKRVPPQSRYRGTGQAAFRRRTLAKTDGRCAVCGSTDRVVAHHPIQLQHGGTHEQDGVPLCHRHHQAVERTLRRVDRAR
jgi:predicted restriction endonuclease